jgi:hypothetical protein
MTGERVETPQGMGVVVGWHGPLAIVSLDAGGYVEVQERPTNRTPVRYDVRVGSSDTISDIVRAAPSRCLTQRGGVAASRGSSLDA